MLAALAIRDIVLIERLDVAFGKGLSVLTGETGAGKSILLDSLSLALGARGAGGLVRHGAEQGQVTAVFELAATHPAHSILADNAIDDDDGRLILRRVQSADGRTRAFVNDQPVSAALLRTLGSALVEIHGQHDDRALVEPAAHRALLDAYGGLLADASAVRASYRSWRDAEAAVAELKRRIEAGRNEAAYLRAAVEELGALGPEPGEEEALAERRQAMMRAEKIAGDIDEANEVVAGSASPVPALAGLVRRLERKRGEAGPLLDGTIEALDRSLVALDEAASALQEAMRAAEFDPHELERTEERLFALRAAGRKYNVPVDTLAELAAGMATTLAELDAGDAELAGLEAQERDAATRFATLAAALSAGRHEAAKRLEAAVAVELPALKLERAAILARIDTDPDAPGEDGIDRVAFWVRTNPGAPAGPMMKVASGGELSRFLLALKVALADRGSAPTLIFDEIDSGVGGAVSDAIGQRLARLSGAAQVLAVTHAPQVAARADDHYLIAKADHGTEDRVVTSVARLDTPKRREEIARMLAGAEITDEARAAAARLMAGAA